FNKQKSLTLYAAMGGILNIIFDVLLIPKFGITGSAIATLSAQFISNIYLRHIVKQNVDYRILRRLKRVFVATALMAIACFVLNLAGIHVLVVIGTGIIVYGITLLLLKEPIIKEIRFILQPNTAETASVNIS
ncbi:MAG: polysaccharide biosynthesis C-terminal domain-containing protein, partial [bacterium]|nr:polysaccharide biosynthesis C-terminal domain-containing protein [bacterium]